MMQTLRQAWDDAEGMGRFWQVAAVVGGVGHFAVLLVWGAIFVAVVAQVALRPFGIFLGDLL